MILRAMMAARQVKSDHPDKKGYPGPPGLGLGMRLKIPLKKKSFFEKLLIFETEWKEHR